VVTESVRRSIMVENMEKLVLFATSLSNYEIYEHDLHATLADERPHNCLQCSLLKAVSHHLSLPRLNASNALAVVDGCLQGAESADAQMKLTKAAPVSLGSRPSSR
jgi:hypothetical protein